MYKQYGLVVVLALTVFLIAACGKSPTPTTVPVPTQVPPTDTPVAMATTPPTITPAPTATTAPTNTPVPTPTNTPVPPPTPTIDLNAAKSNLPPHIFAGTAKIDGVAAPRGTIVSAVIGDQVAGLGVVDKADGGFTPIAVDVLNQMVTFKVGDFAATQSPIQTKMGEGTILDLNASSQ